MQKQLTFGTPADWRELENDIWQGILDGMPACPACGAVLPPGASTRCENCGKATLLGQALRPKTRRGRRSLAGQAPQPRRSRKSPPAMKLEKAQGGVQPVQPELAIPRFSRAHILEKSEN